MLRQRKIQILAATVPTSICFSIIFIDIFFAPLLLKTLYFVTFIPVVFILLYFCLPIGRWRIGGEEAKPRISFFRWFLFIIVIEALLSLLFLSQYGILFYHVVLEELPNFTDSSVSMLDLLPWILLATVSVVFAVASYRHSTDWSFNSLITQQKQSFFYYAVQIIIAIYLRLTGRFFIALNIVIMILLLTFFAHSSFNILQPIDSIFIGIILFFLYFRESSQKLFALVEGNRLSVGLLAIFLIVLISIFLIVIDIAVSVFILPRMHQIYSSSFSLIPHAFIATPLAWQLWSWAWWIIAIPLFASLLVSVSYGRKVYAFLLMSCALPVMIVVLFYLARWYRVSLNVDNAMLLVVFLGLLGQGLFLGFLCFRKSLVYSWYGFMPTEFPKKLRSRSINQLWLFVVILLVVLLFYGMQYWQLLAVLLAIPLIIIFLVNMAIV